MSHAHVLIPPPKIKDPQIVTGFFQRDEIQRVQEAQDAYYRGEFNRLPEFSWPKPRPCSSRSRKHPYSSFFRQEIQDLVCDGRLAQLLRKLTGIGQIRLWHDQLLYEEPRKTAAPDYHWHRESSRWKTCQGDAMVTAWIPLEDFSVEMGPLTFTDPSFEKHRPMTLKMGDLVIFDQEVMHGNPPNLGDRPRRALAAHFASANIQYQAHGKFSHVNERLVRKVNGLPDFRDPAVCPLLS